MMVPGGNNNQTSFWRMLLILAPIVTAINLGVAGWLITQIVDIQASSFTSYDGQEIWRALEQKADRQEVPPVWFVQRVDKIENRLNGIENMLAARVEKIEVRLDRIEAILLRERLRKEE